MSKLDELGGLEAAKAEAKERDRIPDGQLLSALIEEIESSASERDELKKQVEEFEEEIEVRDQKDFYDPDAKLHEFLDSLGIMKCQAHPDREDIRDGSFARIERHVKSLTAERDQLKGRVEELEAFARYRDAIFDLLTRVDSKLSWLHHQGYIRYELSGCPDCREVEEIIAELRTTLAGRVPNVSKLGAARKLADIIFQCLDADEKTTLHQDTVAMLRSKARDFLKMLEETHAS